MSSNTTSNLTILHLELDGFFPFFQKDYKPDQDFEFRLTLSSQHSNACCIYQQMVLLG
jgi:hypothetical protein